MADTKGQGLIEDMARQIKAFEDQRKENVKDLNAAIGGLSTGKGSVPMIISLLRSVKYRQEKVS